MTDGPDRSQPMRPPRWPLALYLAIALLYLLVFGYQVRIPFDGIHLIERELLAQHLVQSLWHYHAQPPLPNLVLGLAIQVADSTGIRLQSVLLPFLLMLGWITVFALRCLAFGLLPRAVAGLVCLCWLLYPPFYEFLFLYYFVPFEMACLVALPALALLYARKPTVLRLAAFALGLIVLTCSRSLFHPLFAVVLLICITVYRRGLPAAPPRQRFWITGLALLVICLWPAKNLLQFGFFGYSSWQGAQLVRQLPVPEHPLRSMFYLPHVEPMPAPLKAARHEAAEQVPPSLAQIPVVARLAKQSGSPNWNHHAMIRYGAEQQRAALAAMVAHPGAVLSKIRHHYVDAWVQYPLRHPTVDVVEHAKPDPWLVSWSSLVDSVLFHGGIGFRLFAFLFPLVFLCSAVRVWRALRSGHPHGVPLAVALAAVVFVTAMALLVDGEEGNRMRLSIDHLLLLLAATLVVRRPVED